MYFKFMFLKTTFIFIVFHLVNIKISTKLSAKYQYLCANFDPLIIFNCVHPSHFSICGTIRIAIFRDPMHLDRVEKRRERREGKSIKKRAGDRWSADVQRRVE